MVKCKYAKVGCEEEMVREKCKMHEVVSLECHLQLAVDRISTLESKVREPTVPVVFKLLDFSKLKDANDVWYSGGFYSHPGGYQMVLRVDANGAAKEYRSHLLVYMYLAGGEYDDNLVWPFNGTITIELLNQLQDCNHYTVELRLTDSSSGAKRPPQGATNRGLGWPKFLSHTSLKYRPSKHCQYLKDDCLHFRVSKVDINPSYSIKSWLAL